MAKVLILFFSLAMIVITVAAALALLGAGARYDNDSLAPADIYNRALTAKQSPVPTPRAVNPSLKGPDEFQKINSQPAAGSVPTPTPTPSALSSEPPLNSSYETNYDPYSKYRVGN